MAGELILHYHIDAIKTFRTLFHATKIVNILQSTRLLV